MGDAVQTRTPARGIWPAAAFCALALGIGAAQALAQDVTITPKLKAGDQFRLALVRNRENSSQSQQSGGSKTIVSVSVISATPEGFVVDWVPGETVLDNPVLAQNPLISAALEAVRDLHFHLTLNATGKLTGLANQAEVVPKLKSIVDTIVKELLARLPAERRQAMLGMVNQVVSPEALVVGATRDAWVYFGLNGMALASGDVTEVEVQQPSLLGSDLIPGTFRVRMESVTEDSASLTATTTYDKAALMRLTESLAKQAGVPIPPEALAKLPPIEMSDEGSYVFDRTVGLMREVNVKRRVAAGRNERVDSWEIRLLDGPQR
jgi:hypothetical protein